MKELVNLLRDEKGDTLQAVIIAAVGVGLIWLIYAIAKPRIQGYTETYGGWLDSEAGKAPD